MKTSGDTGRRRIWLKAIRILFLERFELKDVAAVEQRFVDLEEASLYGGTNESELTSFHIGQDCTLRRIVPEMSFVHEQRSALTQEFKTHL